MHLVPNDRRKPHPGNRTPSTWPRDPCEATRATLCPASAKIPRPARLTGVEGPPSPAKTVAVEGKLGKLDFEKHPLIDVAVEDHEVVVTRQNEERATKALHGTTRSLISNMIRGVSEGFTRSLEISGVGWNAKLQGQKLALNIGYADTRYVDIPQGVNIEVNGPNIKVSGAEQAGSSARLPLEGAGQPSPRAVQRQGHQVRPKR